MTEFKPKLNRSLYKDISNLFLLLGGIVVIVLCYRLYPDLMTAVLLLGAFLIIGFFLPRYIGSKTAIRRAHQHKSKEFVKWGLVSRDREGPWLNYITFPVVKKTPLCANMTFYSEWLIIEDGMIIVNPGASEVDRKQKIVKYDINARRTYSWDGCSPKRWFYWLAIIGTPDWHKKEIEIDTLVSNTAGQWLVEKKNVFWQLTDHASLVHDALYQYLDSIPLEKPQVDRLFYEMLKEAGMLCCLRWIYFMAVKIFGGKGCRDNLEKCEFTIKGATFVSDLQNTRQTQVQA